MLFANFAEAMAEGRGKAQADSLRKTKSETLAKKLVNGNGKFELTPASALRKGDVVVCEPNDIIPGDGDVIEGIASVDESVITGESRRSFANRAATAAPSPAAPRCFPTSSRSGSPPTPAKPSSTA